MAPRVAGPVRLDLGASTEGPWHMPDGGHEVEVKGGLRRAQAHFSMRLRTASALRPVSAMLLLQTPFQPLIMVVKSRSPSPCNFPHAATHVRQFGGRRILPHLERRKFSNATSRLGNNATRYGYNFRMLSNRWGHSWPLEWMRC